MNNIQKGSLERLGYDFVTPEFIPAGKDEYHIRNEQLGPERAYRGLRAHEIEILVKNENRADDWSKIFVTDRFNPELVKSCHFFGMVRIGDLEPMYLQHHDLRLAVGIYRSTIVSCDIGNNVAIHNVEHLSHYIIDDEVMLMNIQEMQTTNYAKFGNGILKDGEDEKVRVWLELWNELEGRSVLPFDGMLPADAYLWAKYRENEPLLRRFKEMVDARYDRRRGYYGTVGRCSVIKHCGIIKDAKIGSHAYIKGANKLKNLTINSDERESTQIGEGCELVNGIVGYGCRIFYGVKAVRFIMGTRSNLKYGARLINSFLGDNSTVSCCEMLHNLVFPSHEQHHNNSFLVAACLKGQSNVAAGATIGSNHNSRANDGEIVAGRGFWPGLCTSLKHNCRFASFVLLAKGSYPAELDIPLPFSLVSNIESKNELEVMPAYWFMYNAYALARNAWKFQARDSRIHADQKMEFDYLAPDTVEEVFAALELLEEWTAKAWMRSHGQDPAKAERAELLEKGRHLLMHEPDAAANLEILGERMEHSRRKVLILKAPKAYAIYREMLHYYAMKNLVGHMLGQSIDRYSALRESLPAGPRVREWINLGGQLACGSDVERLKARIIAGELETWDDVHREYDRLWRRYPRDKAAHAFAALLDLHGIAADQITPALWVQFLDQAKETQDKLARLTRESRAKDFENPFKRMSFDTQGEMDAVMGTLEDNGFVKELAQQAQRFAEDVEKLRRSESA